MANFKTVDVPATSPDALRDKKQEDVAKMRTSLLACGDDPREIVHSIKTVTVLRVIHQVSRIVSYLDMMDRIEDKLYQSIDEVIDTLDTQDLTTWSILLNLQSRLQQNMIESHKLLEPYLNIEDLGMIELSESVSPDVVPESEILSRESRDELRENARKVLALLEPVAEESKDE